MISLNKLWYKKNALAFGLAPLAFIYSMGMWLRRLSFKWGLRRTTHFSTPVIVVGNITVGGTGKTPLVAALALKLREQGFRPGLVGRGYGGHAHHWPQEVKTDSDPWMVGDEAVWLVQKTACPMVVAPDRVEAVKTLLTKQACDVVISDDGLQHLALGRHYQIAVVDGERGFGNGLCLPAGPLRESLNYLKVVDCLVVNGGKNPNSLPQMIEGRWSKPWFRMQFKPVCIYNLLDNKRCLNVAAMADKTIHACAGIGHPQRFFESLRSLGFKSIIPHIFPDHYHYTKADIDFGKDAIVIMTEKDAVKCCSLGNASHWCLSVDIDIGEAFWITINNMIKNKTI